MKDVDEAIDFAVLVERGCRHSAMIHSRDIEKLSRMSKAMNCSLFVNSESQVVLNLRPHGFEFETTTTLRVGAGFGLPTAMNYRPIRNVRGPR
jgi:propionaldehyde dehydrogenase